MFSFIRGRGGVGRSFTRAETVERMNALIQNHNELMYASEAAIASLQDRDAANKLDLLQSTSRVDIAKLSETIVSNGGTPPLGVDLQGVAFNLGTDDRAILEELERREKAFSDALREETKVRHHTRSQAIIKNTLNNSDARLKVIRDAAAAVKQPVPAR